MAKSELSDRQQTVLSDSERCGQAYRRAPAKIAAGMVFERAGMRAY